MRKNDLYRPQTTGKTNFLPKNTISMFKLHFNGSILNSIILEKWSIDFAKNCVFFYHFWEENTLKYPLGDIFPYVPMTHFPAIKTKCLLNFVYCLRTNNISLTF